MNSVSKWLLQVDNRLSFMRKSFPERDALAQKRLTISNVHSTRWLWSILCTICKYMNGVRSVVSCRIQYVCKNRSPSRQNRLLEILLSTDRLWPPHWIKLLCKSLNHGSCLMRKQHFNSVSITHFVSDFIVDHRLCLSEYTFRLLTWVHNSFNVLPSFQQCIDIPTKLNTFMLRCTSSAYCTLHVLLLLRLINFMWLTLTLSEHVYWIESIKFDLFLFIWFCCKFHTSLKYMKKSVRKMNQLSCFID